MRSEADIRRQVEMRFHRWIFLLFNGGTWAAVSVGLYLYYRANRVPAGWVDSGWVSSAIIVMLMWGAVVGLHFLRTIYVEMRESLVRRAIERERQAYLLLDAYEKRKRDETSRRLTDDGELINWSVAGAEAEAKAKHER